MSNLRNEWLENKLSPLLYTGEVVEGKPQNLKVFNHLEEPVFEGTIYEYLKERLTYSDEQKVNEVAKKFGLDVTQLTDTSIHSY